MIAGISLESAPKPSPAAKYPDIYFADWVKPDRDVLFVAMVGFDYFLTGGDKRLVVPYLSRPIKWHGVINDVRMGILNCERRWSLNNHCDYPLTCFSSSMISCVINDGLGVGMLVRNKPGLPRTLDLRRERYSQNPDHHEDMDIQLGAEFFRELMVALDPSLKTEVV